MTPLSIVHPLSMLLVALGGAVGCMIRFAMIQLVVGLNPTGFPLGTVVVNILGSFVIGVVLIRYGAEHSVRAFLVTGVLGGFTTFSAFSWDMLQLLQQQAFWQAALYVAASVGLSLLAVWAGVIVGR